MSDWRFLLVVLGPILAVNAVSADQESALQTWRNAGAQPLYKNGELYGFGGNRSMVTDKQLPQLHEFAAITDLSLEETGVTCETLPELPRLEWLNLYRSKLTDKGLARVARLPKLQLLPIGETQISDKGLKHLQQMQQLRYLGLRGTRVTDDGLLALSKLTKLQQLYLGETKIGDEGLQHLKDLVQLRKLWLNESQVGDASIALIATRFRLLEELHVYGAKFTEKGIATLRRRLPRAEIIAIEP